MSAKPVSGVEGEDVRRARQERLYPSGIRGREEELIGARRKVAYGENAQASLKNAPTGLAISGGGIRSATFALGVVQALAEKDLLRRFDYLSTVSGGGYFGSFLGSLFARIHQIVKHAPVRGLLEEEEGSAAGLVQAALRDNSHSVIDHLRQNGQYLAPGGSDRLLFGAVLLRNWLSLMIVVGSFTLTIALGLETLWAALLLNADNWPVWMQPFNDPALVASPWLLLALAALLCAIPLGWAYWILDQVSWLRAALGAALGTGSLVGLAALRKAPNELLWLIGGIGLAAILVALGLTLWSRWRSKREANGEKESGFGDVRAQRRLNGDTWARHTISGCLKTTLLALGVFLFLAATDSLGRYIYHFVLGNSWTIGKIWGAIWALLLSVVPFASKFSAFLGKKEAQGRPGSSVNLITAIVAAIVLFSLLASASVFAQALARDPLSVRTWCHVPSECLKYAGLSFAATLLISLVIGWTHSLLNRSTQLPLYSARITRAYLGASNPKRYSEVSEKSSKPHPSAATALREDDDVPATDYFGWNEGKIKPPWENGGPLHIINTTLNETIDGRSKAHELDRKGLGMAVGPHGLSVGARHHLTFNRCIEGPKPEGFSVFPELSTSVPDGEKMLSLGLWASISGAAFSTGLGSRTRPAFSLLAGLTNVRLGHWWHAPGTRHEPAPGWSFFWVQKYLFRELSARFPGTADPYWYLSDGGHFENMGAYELIRRRLPFILIIDGEADPDHAFEGLANLVRKARLDFETEIEFLSEPFREFELSAAEECPYGSLDDLKPKGPQRISRKQACLAKVKYPPGNFGCDEGYLVYVKATLFPSVPADLRHYAQTNPAFPQETTIDQFFDEAQWESYRKLGHLVGMSLFGNETAPFARLMSGPRKSSTP